MLYRRQLVLLGGQQLEPQGFLQPVVQRPYSGGPVVQRPYSGGPVVQRLYSG